MPAEAMARETYLSGYALDLLVPFIAQGSPRPASQDYPRLRWVISGCLIGLPAFIFRQPCEDNAMAPVAGQRLAGAVHT
jgi:hypothetical protein